MRLLKATMPLIAVLAIAGCSDDDEPKYGNVKFYNASYNSGVVATEVMDKSGETFLLPATHLSDVTPTYTAEDGTYELAVTHTIGQSDEVIDVVNSGFEVDGKYMSLLVLNGDLQQPELLNYSYDVESIYDLIEEDQNDGLARFEMYVANLSDSYPLVDVYASNVEQSFAQADLLYTGQNTELSDLQILAQGEWVFYLTEQGSTDVIYQSDAVNINFVDTFVFFVNDGATENSLVLDSISTIGSSLRHANQNAPASMKFIQSDEAITAVDVFAESSAQLQVANDLTANTLSQQYDLVADDFTFTVTDAIAQDEVYLSNLLLSLQPSEANNLVFYTNAEGNMQAVSVPQNNVPLAYENQLTLVNLTHQEQGLDIFAVNSSYSISETPTSITSLDQGQAAQLLVGGQDYQLVVTNSTQSEQDDIYILGESAMINYEQGANYLVLIETDSSDANLVNITLVREN